MDSRTLWTERGEKAMVARALQHGAAALVAWVPGHQRPKNRTRGLLHDAPQPSGGTGNAHWSNIVSGTSIGGRSSET